jgi:hypothetical protein
MCQTTTNNPAPISIPANAQLVMSCNAHASFTQQVILSFNQDMSSPIGQFVGSGEGIAMTPNFTMPVPSGNSRILFAKFNFQTSLGGPFLPALHVCTPVVTGSITNVFSEDNSDNDDNDSYLTVVAFSEGERAEEAY